jgi:hypothetical protein
VSLTSKLQRLRDDVAVLRPSEVDLSHLTDDELAQADVLVARRDDANEIGDTAGYAAACDALAGLLGAAQARLAREYPL